MNNKEVAIRLTELIVQTKNENSMDYYTELGIRRIYKELLKELEEFDKEINNE